MVPCADTATTHASRHHACHHPHMSQRMPLLYSIPPRDATHGVAASSAATSEISISTIISPLVLRGMRARAACTHLQYNDSELNALSRVPHHPQATIQCSGHCILRLDRAKYVNSRRPAVGLSFCASACLTSCASICATRRRHMASLARARAQQAQTLPQPRVGKPGQKLVHVH